MKKKIIPNPQVEALGSQQLSFDGVACFPENIREMLEGNWSDRSLLGFLLDNSEVCRILYKNPADFEMLEVAYWGESDRGIDVRHGIDDWLRNMKSAQALRDRLKVVSEFVARWITRHASLRDMRYIIDLGSGPGPYAFETLKQLDFNCPMNFFWDCIDIDKLAVALGEQRADELGFADWVGFRQGNFVSPDNFPDEENEKADLGLLVGILCGMTPEQAVSTLKRIKPHFKDGGEIVAATLLKKSFKEDPLSFRVFCNVLGWQLRPKTLAEVKEIFRQAEYDIIDIFSEREDGDGQYAIVHAVIK